MFIYGPNGTGKSHTAKAVSRWARRLAIDLPLVSDDGGMRLAQSKYVFWPKFCKEEKDRMRSGDTDEGYDEILKSEFLILDDVGAEHDPSRWAVEQFYMILDIRFDRWTLITSNVSPSSWDTRFEKRISSRLVRNCELADLEGVPDFNDAAE